MQSLTNTENTNYIMEAEKYIWEKIQNDWSFSIIIKRAITDKQLDITPDILKTFAEKILQNFAYNEEYDALAYFIRKFDALNNININITLPEGYTSFLPNASSTPDENKTTKIITDKIDVDHIDNYYLYWILGGITLIVIAGVCYYLYKKHKKKKSPDNGGGACIIENITEKRVEKSNSKNFFKYSVTIKNILLFLVIIFILEYMNLLTYNV